MSLEPKFFFSIGRGLSEAQLEQQLEIEHRKEGREVKVKVRGINIVGFCMIQIKNFLRWPCSRVVLLRCTTG